MNRKIFVITVFALLTILMLCPPVIKALEEAGLVGTQSAGIELEKPEPDQSILAGIVNPVNEVKYDVQMTYQNYMPFNISTIVGYKTFLRTINRPVYSLYEKPQQKPPKVPETGDTGKDDTDTDNTDNPVDKPDEKISSVFLGATALKRYYKVTVEKDGTEYSFLEAICTLSEEEKAARVEEQIKNVNRLIKADPNVNVCVYVAANLQFQDFLSDYIPDESSDAEYLERFLAGIDDSAVKGAIKFDDVYDRIDRVYLTDHHWSTYGSYCGCRDIIGLMRQKCPDILPARELGSKLTVEPCTFYGSSARTLAYKELYDPFVVYDYSLPYHISKPQLSFEEQVEKLKAQNINSLNSNAYEAFFPEIYNVKYPENNTGRKLLIIGDSYTQGFAELIGSSFDETTVFYWRNYQTLNYNDYIEENGITDVLIMLFGERMVFNATNDYFLDRIAVKGGDC